MRVAQVTAKIGDSIVAVAYDEELAIEGDLVEIEVAEVEWPPARVPRPTRDWRVAGYIIGALLVHVFVIARPPSVAPAKRDKRRPPIVAHPVLVHIAETPVVRAAPAVAAVGTHAVRPAVIRKVTKAGPADVAATLARLDAVISPEQLEAKLAAVGPIVHADWTTETYGVEIKHAGIAEPGDAALIHVDTATYHQILDVNNPYHYESIGGELALCESKLCEVTGGLTREQLVAVAKPHAFEIATCLQRGDAILELTISPAGKLVEAKTTSKAAQCAADVMTGLIYPKAEAKTRATFTLGYP